MLVLAWLVFRPRAWRAALVFALVAAGVYGLIVLAAGPHDSSYTPAAVWAANTNPLLLPSAVVYNLLYLPLWMAAARRWPDAPRELRRLAHALGLVYVPLFLLLGAWQEVRLLMPLVLVALPIALRERH